MKLKIDKIKNIKYVNIDRKSTMIEIIAKKGGVLWAMSLS